MYCQWCCSLPLVHLQCDIALLINEMILEFGWVETKECCSAVVTNLPHSAWARKVAQDQTIDWRI